MPRKTYSNKTRKRQGRDMDQLVDDTEAPEKRAKWEKEHPVDEDLPGAGQFYCVECSRHFNDAATLEHHRRGKLHKQRAKRLAKEKAAPYSQKEAEAAGGMGS